MKEFLNDKMKRPLELLILLGFITQGLTWDNYLMPVIFAGVWWFCLKYQRETPLFSKDVEIGVFAIALILTYGLGGNNIFNRSVSAGNSLLVLQAMRLLKRMTYREKMLAVVMAVTQLAIGSLLVFDYTFLPILLATIILLPAAWTRIEGEKYGVERLSAKMALGKLEWGLLIVFMIGFFLVFPRRQVLIRGAGGSFKVANAGRMRAELDTDDGGMNIAGRELFQVEGDDLGYLKSFALDTFDGNTWKAGDFSYAIQRRMRGVDPAKDLRRNVTVKDPRPLGLALPTDGYVVSIKGNFFQDPFISRQGNVMVSMTWLDNNCHYEYWIRPRAIIPLTSKERKICLEIPNRNERLEAFVAETTTGTKSSLTKVRRLAERLRTELKYEIGAPKLDRMNPVEDFIFNAKKGHCERFASALALLSRIAGVPSRVVIGFVAHDRNQFADFYQVRTNDAHAWTEVYIDGKGWTTVDATPFLEVMEANRRTFAMAIMDWLEFVWFGKIVNYSMNDQTALAFWSVSTFRSLVSGVGKVLLIGLALLATGSFVLMIARRRKGRGWRKKGNTPESRTDSSEASMFYRRMMKTLRSKGLFRVPSQTPLEFSSSLKDKNAPVADDVEELTSIYLPAKYGGSTLTENMRKRIDRLLEKIRKTRNG